MVLDDVEKDCLEIEENSDSLFWDIIDIVELFNTVALYIVGSVYW